MRFSRTPIIGTALRPALQQTPRLRPAQTRLATMGPGSGPQGEVGDKGPVKDYNKDGTNPNKNIMYIGLGALALGGVYAMFSSKPEKVAEKVQQKANSPPAR
ncbi:hypothetical protein C8A00DRAFT_45251 [Chaetomidium leptoderma]|uniref:Uncharacterized protein n=1 Tax=Chaetomidium leptoderma TaxID=669021 RepID=A0AAN6VHW4_9PEZI|nr:hypothetical protein C8A00DRAFT_45251 [Chaetomidium leptoderma]